MHQADIKLFDPLVWYYCRREAQVVAFYVESYSDQLRATLALIFDIEYEQVAALRLVEWQPIHLVNHQFWQQDMAWHTMNNAGDRQLAFAMTRETIIQFYGYGVDYRLASELPF